MGVSYNDFISAVANYYNAEAGIPPTAQWASSTTWSTVSTDMARVGITSDNYINYLENFPELFDITRNVDGSVLDSSLKKYMYYGNVNGYNTNTGGALNSNSIPSTFAESTGLNVSGLTSKATTGSFSVKGGIGLKADTGLTAKGVVSTIGTAVMAVGVGATLGKIVGDGLYQSNPNFWATGKLSSLSNTDWNKFAIAIKNDVGTVIDNGVLALWGVNDDTTTMYLDENALAYMSWWMNENNVFANSSEYNAPSDSLSSINVTNFLTLNDLCAYISSKVAYPDYYTLYSTMVANGVPETGLLYFRGEGLTSLGITHGSISTTWYVEEYKPKPNINTSIGVIKFDSITRYSFEYLASWGGNNKFVFIGKSSESTSLGKKPWGYSEKTSSDGWTIELKIWNTNASYSTPLDGISDNPNSVQFDPTGIGSVSTALGALKNQYPNLWNNAVKRNTVQDDGSEDERIYVPIPIPKYNNPFDNQPTTGTPSQTEPSIKPDTTPKEDLDNISNTITKDPTQTNNNIGGGSTPSIIIPSQQASALWAIYNPTLTQLNSLGAWLWSSNFIDQILKIFNDPMQAIIGLHKVYATPNISGSGNIKVGYLDSGVPSNIVGNQYTYIDCGTVSLREYYGNILDYSPYTTVQLYLPFIGIVSLDIADVSRSSITVKYGVDVLTGACLASVSVQRDNAGGVLYQYSGNCACQYPLSSGSYMGMVTGAIGTIGSLAKGNIFGSALSIAGMHTNIEHSGGFSGNSGAMGIKKPYLIISRPQSVMNDGFPSIQGYPSNYYTRLGNCSGFTQVAECHVENISATDKELDKIKDLLKDGVIL
jgi:hypothetical protein